VPVPIISRSAWGARFERGFGPAPLPASEVWLHHSVTVAPDLVYLDPNKDGVDDDEKVAVQTLESIGEQRFGRGISYTFIVMPSGRVYEGHGVDRVGAHTGGRNSIARAICWLGNYDVYRPTEIQRRATAALLQDGAARGWWNRRTFNGGHQQAPGAQTACPGRYGMAALAEVNRLAAGPIITNINPGGTVADSPLVQDAAWRILALARLHDVQQGGPSEDDPIEFVPHYKALVGRQLAVLKNTETVTWGPTSGETNDLAGAINKLLTVQGEQTALLEANAAKLDQIIAMLESQTPSE
jgi:N-acetylmuramoyl-L-alanine amidase